MPAPMPFVSQYMTPMPYTVDPESSLEAALLLMEQYQIHHLPVLADSKIVGLLALHDLQLLTTYAPVALDCIKVRQIMDKSPYCVSPETLLSTVAQHMSAQRLNATLVIQEDGSLIGIFTDADALAAFAGFLRRRARRDIPAGVEELEARDSDSTQSAH